MSEHEHTAEDEPGSNSTPDASGAQRVADLQAWLKRPRQAVARRSTSSRRCCARSVHEMPRPLKAKLGPMTEDEQRTSVRELTL